MRGAKYLVAAVLLTVASVLTAQSRTEMDTGSHISVPERARIPASGSEADRSRVALAEFARCTVDRHAGALNKLLVLSPDKTNGRNWATLADSECLSEGQMRFKAILLRGAIFVELYRRRMIGSVADKSHFMPPSRYDPAAASASTDDDVALQMGLLAFADCIVQRDRGNASAMIVAPATSTAGNAAFIALRPALGPCLLQGQQIKLSRPVLEGSIAEILYRGSASEPTVEAK